MPASPPELSSRRQHHRVRQNLHVSLNAGGATVTCSVVLSSRRSKTLAGTRGPVASSRSSSSASSSGVTILLRIMIIIMASWHDHPDHHDHHRQVLIFILQHGIIVIEVGRSAGHAIRAESSADSQRMTSE
eukprot:1280997-Rhodomonas_salina.6